MPSTAVRKSLVVVLPVDPVTPITGHVRRARWDAARSCTARNASGTRTTHAPRLRAVASTSASNASARVIMTARAPERIAVSRYPCPSTFSPLNATKTFPGSTARESVASPLIMTSPLPRSSVPPTTSVRFSAESISTAVSAPRARPHGHRNGSSYQRISDSPHDLCLQ